MACTYERHAKICHKFYQLTVDATNVAKFILARSLAQPPARALFVGGMFDIAAALSRDGFTLSLVDYSREMVALGRAAHPDLQVEQADLRALPYQAEFDYLFVVGRVFTHMISDQDLLSALHSCRRALRPAGCLFFDNYESSKIRVTEYFNGEIVVKSDQGIIKRVSSTSLISKSPCVVEWQAHYSGSLDGDDFEFSDMIEQRAWSRSEIAPFLNETGFRQVSQGDNFDPTSFYTLARAI